MQLISHDSLKHSSKKEKIENFLFVFFFFFLKTWEITDTETQPRFQKVCDIFGLFCIAVMNETGLVTGRR